MADEQSETLSAEPQTATDAGAPEPSSAEPDSQSSKAPSWWSRMFHRRGGVEETGPQGEDSTTESASSVVSLSQEELDKRVQAEADRREFQRQRAEKERAKRELRDKDPWAYAEQERKEEEAQQGNFHLERFVTDLGAEHDKVTVDPVFFALPKAEQERILKLEGAGIGLPGRKLVVSESLKALEKHWKAEGAKDAEAKLRRNPAFRKQVLSEMRGATPEPELLPAGSASEADKSVSELLRSYYRLG
jgi:hypothetical protein